MTNSVSLSAPRAASSQRLQRILGVIAMALPALLGLGGFLFDHVGRLDSISDYYYTDLVAVLVGSLCAFAVVLASYRGYADKDDRVTNIAAVLIVLVALCPTTRPGGGGGWAQSLGVVHYLAAAGFFLTMSWIAARIFTLTSPDQPPTARKLRRNSVYVGCSLIIILCTAAIFLIDLSHLGSHHIVFWLETMAVESFGLAWMTKSGAWLQDLP